MNRLPGGIEQTLPALADQMPLSHTEARSNDGMPVVPVQMSHAEPQLTPYEATSVNCDAHEASVDLDTQAGIDPHLHNQTSPTPLTHPGIQTDEQIRAHETLTPQERALNDRILHNTNTEDADQAFAELFLLHRAKLVNLIRSKVGDEQAAEDMAGDIYLRSRRHLVAGIRPKDEPVYTDNGRGVLPYLYRAVHNRVKDYWRRGYVQSEIRVEPANDYVNPAREYRRAPSRTFTDPVVIEAIGKMTIEGAAELLQAIIVDGMQYEEYAALSGIKLGTIRSRLSRLKEALGPLLREFITASSASSNY